jgi:tetratricopeptide (TPR) repeat protein
MRWLAAAGGLVLLGAAALPWLESPVDPRRSSASVVAAVLGAAVLLLCALERFGSSRLRAALTPVRLLAVAGSVCLTLAAWSVLDLAYADRTLWALVDDNAQYGQIVTFSRTHLTENLGFDPTYESNITTEGVLGRLSAAYYFMGAGWWLVLAAGLILTAATLVSGGGPGLRWTSAGLAGTGLFVAIVIAPAAIAVHRESRADRQLALGRYAEAARDYAAAQGLTGQAQESERIWLRLGEAFARLGMGNHPASQLYLADRDLRVGQADAGISRLRLLAASAPADLRGTVSKRLGTALASSGLGAYASGRVPLAVSRWQEAMDVDTTQTQAAFFLSRAYFDLGRYEASIVMSRQVLSRTRNKIIRADAQANIGDSYTRMGQYALARQAYEASRRLDPVSNFRILRSLGGT